MSKTYADCLDEVLFLKASYAFVGSGEDELSFNKGDVLVVTKKDDGGWWEATVDGKIGWFPSNYVTEIDADPLPTPDTIPPSNHTPDSEQYHKQVVDNILQTQNKHAAELLEFWDKYLGSLQTSDVLNEEDRAVLCGNYNQINKFQEELSKKLQDEANKPIAEQRFGECFLLLRTKMKELYLHYCTNHPQAANLISQHSDELSVYMESLGAPSPGIMTLRTSLSKPFLHIEKYGNQIKELERHIEEGSVDSLDMKKATQVLQIIALSCHEVRKKKEAELEIINGTIADWQGEPISSLGSLVNMGQVFVEKEGSPRRERYFCLFHRDFVVVSVTAQLVGFSFEERHLTADIQAKNVEDTETFFNGFELTIEEKTWKVMTSSPREKDVWMDALMRVLKERCTLTLEIPPLPASTKLERSDSKRSEVRSLPLGDGENTNELFIRSYSTGTALTSHRSNRSESPDVKSSPTHVIASSVTRSLVRQPVKKEWSFTRLRPTPPFQHNSNTEEVDASPKSIRRIVSSKKMVGGRGSRENLIDPSSRKQSTPNVLTTQEENRGGLEEDMMILSVIEAYCFSNQTIKSSTSSSPENPYVAPDVPPHFSFPSLQKPVTPPRSTPQLNNPKPKYLSKKKKKPKENEGPSELDTLKEQVLYLHKQTLYLRENLEEERKSRDTFERSLKRIFQRIAPDIDLAEELPPQKVTPI